MLAGFVIVAFWILLGVAVAVHLDARGWEPRNDRQFLGFGVATITFITVGAFIAHIVSGI